MRIPRIRQDLMRLRKTALKMTLAERLALLDAVISSTLSVLRRESLEVTISLLRSGSILRWSLQVSVIEMCVMS